MNHFVIAIMCIIYLLSFEVKSERTLINSINLKSEAILNAKFFIFLFDLESHEHWID